MGENLPVIVQAEFFLVGKDTDSLEGFLREIGERARDNSSLKLVITFPDDDGSIMRLAQKTQIVGKDLKLLRENFKGRQSFLRRLLARIRLRSAIVKLDQEKRELRLCVMRRVKTLARSEWRHSILIETEYHSFRTVKDNEFHELIESIERSSNLWIFVFKLNGHRNGGKKTMVARVM